MSIASGATAPSVELTNSGDLQVSGSVGSIICEESGTVTINGGTVGGGGIEKKKGSGDISLCGASIGGLVCDDNTPPPTGSGNNIQSAQGQCVRF